MATKARVECKSAILGSEAVTLKLSVRAPDFGRVDCRFRWDLESKAMQAIVAKHATAAESKLDAMEVGDHSELNEYTATCLRVVTDLMRDVGQALYSERSQEAGD